MSADLACIGGGSVYRFIETGRLKARELPPRPTPWGLSQPIYRVESAEVPFYLMSRYRPGRRRPCPHKINYRANLYALKDVGVRCVLCWSGAGAITHNLVIGQVVVPDDIIDLTRQRPATFFENSDRGFLRQFPVICPAMRCALEQATAALGLPCHCSGTAAVTEGPRLETPAEVRMLAAVGAEIVTHTLAPDVFLARELQMCFAGACYLVDYAETGSRHRPFTSGELFAELTEQTHSDRLDRAVAALPDLLERLAANLAGGPRDCPCQRSPGQGAPEGGDWRRMFDTETPSPGG